MVLGVLVPRLRTLPGVLAVTLGGSRAQDRAGRGSDWDFGLYYRGSLSTAAVRGLGYPGEVVEPGAWGRFVNGGAWLTVAGERVDLLYRDLDVVEHWHREAEHGRFEVDLVHGYLAGLPSYVLVGEMAVGRVLAGALPAVRYPPALRRSAPRWWLFSATFSLAYAETYARRGEVSACLGALAKAGLATAHARLARDGVWALSEKGLLARAGLAGLDEVLTAAEPLVATVDRARELLRIAEEPG